MKQKQRLKNDRATTERRETTDQEMSDSRDRNDEATAERRLQSDKDLENSRDRNDEATANRRDAVDRRNSRGILALLLGAIIFLEVVIIFNLI